MARPPTKSSTPRLSEVARHIVVPKGAVSTGWPSVEKKCRDLGIAFDEWQHGAGKVILAKRADGKYAATIGGTALSIPRQVGKTFLVGAIVFALCLLHPGLTVIWTAHRLRTAGETFDKMKGMTRRKRIKAHIAKVVLGSGEEEIRFRNGSRILFGARERGFGRGFDEVDVLIFDEAQILTENAIDDMVPAMNQSRQAAGGLMLFMGTPPKPSDPGEVFTRMRTEALSGEDEDTGYIELSADPDFEPTPSPAPMTAKDWKQIARANPSYPTRTPREAILRMRKKLTPESMRREGYGIWDPEDATSVLPAWDKRRIDPCEPPSVGGFGIAVDLDLHWSAIGSAGYWPDEKRAHVAIGQSEDGTVDHGLGTAWLIPRAKYLQDAYDCGVFLDSKCPDQNLAARLTEAGVAVTELSLDDMLEGVSTFITDTAQNRITHFGEPDLVAAVAGCVKRYVGDRPLWGRKSGDITPLEAVTIARRGLDMEPDGPIELAGSLAGRGGSDGSSRPSDGGADSA